MVEPEVLVERVEVEPLLVDDHAVAFDHGDDARAAILGEETRGV